jgi:hypothetical protein
VKIKIASGTPKVAVPGLGIVETGEWINITKEQEERFEMFSGQKLKDVFNVQKEKKSTKKEAS